MMTRNYLVEFLDGAANRPYRGLIQYHIRRQSTQQLLHAGIGERELLPEQHRGAVLVYIDAVNGAVGYDREFWATATCGEAMRVILRIADSSFELAGQICPGDPLASADQNLAFQLFQIPTLNFAYSASQDRRQRKFMGIRKGCSDRTVTADRNLDNSLKTAEN